MNSEKTEKLLQLIKENPTLPIVPMVDYEVCQDDYNGYWMGSFGSCEVEEYATYGERYYTDKDELKEDYFNNNVDFFEGLSEAETEKLLEKKTGHWWIKAIIVYIELPD